MSIFKTHVHKIKNNKIKKIKFKKNKKNILLLLIKWLFILGFFLLIIGITVIYFLYIKDLKPITDIEKENFPESSIIYDREGNELYRIATKERRVYVEYENFSKHMVDALTSAEDKTFFINAGLDYKALVRAVFKGLVGGKKIKGTSTLSQQLIKNMLLKNERSIDRKIKEAYLANQLNSHYSKGKILELYLNKIEFGGNIYGIQQASETFFHKHIKNIDILESSILASLPKSPTGFSPYNHRDRLMGYLYTYPANLDNKNNLNINKTVLEVGFKNKNPDNILVNKFYNIISGLEIKRIKGDFKNVDICGLEKNILRDLTLEEREKGEIINFRNKLDKKGCIRTEYNNLFALLNNIQIKGNIDGIDTVLEYEAGRKDFVLGRMLADTVLDKEDPRLGKFKITPNDYKTSILRGLDFKFFSKIEHIKAPHFVFYIKEYFTEKYGKNFWDDGGYKIYTTLDPFYQKIAEDVVYEGSKNNQRKFGAHDASLISINNKTGEILAYVGSRDYYDSEAGGQNDLVRPNKPKQPGSTFKPLVYALAISKFQISPESPVFDVSTKFGGWAPKNFDGKFKGIIPLKVALNHSRNIPAVKMYFLGGGQEAVINHVQKLGIESINPNIQYGATLALGTAGISSYEMAQAYSTLANNGHKREITPILKVIDTNGNVIEALDITIKPKEVFSPAASYITTSILSDTSARPSSWNKFMSLKNRAVAAKTGTSTKPCKNKWGTKTICPGNMWTIGYTPQITTAVWTGNVDGTPPFMNANGLEVAGPIWHDYMIQAMKFLPVEEFKKPDGTAAVNISSLSGKLAGSKIPKGFVTSGLFVKEQVPGETDNSFTYIEVDSLCGGKVTNKTPKSAIKKGYYVKFSPLIDSQYKSWYDSSVKWMRGGGGQSYLSSHGGSGYAVFSSIPTKECERPDEPLSVGVKSNLYTGAVKLIGDVQVAIGITSNHPVTKLKILLNGASVRTVNISNLTSTHIDTSIRVGSAYIGKQNIAFSFVDEFGGTFTTGARVINFVGEDNSPPVISARSSIITIFENETTFISAKSSDMSGIKSMKIMLDGKTIVSNNKNNISVTLNSSYDIPVGKHAIVIESIDNKFNRATHALGLEVKAR